MKNVRSAQITAFAFSLVFCAHSSLAAGKAVSTLRGYDAFREKDWASASIFLRESVNTPSEATPEILYMLIMSEMNAHDYKNVSGDCDLFLRSYPKSPYTEIVLFQKARAAFCLEDYNSAILIFSDFCNQNVGHELYPSALFWIAESFYALYDFDSAKDFFERIVSSYADYPKREDAQRRLEEIAHWEREEKLLYLLKVTGEEYLAAKEEYERELKLYKNSDIDGLRQKIREYGLKISELEARNAELETEAENARAAAKAAALAPAPVQQSALVPPTGIVAVPTKAGSAVPPAQEPASPVQEKAAEEKEAKPSTKEPPAKKSAEGIMTESELEALKAKALRVQELLDGDSESKNDGM